MINLRNLMYLITSLLQSYGLLWLGAEIYFNFYNVNDKEKLFTYFILVGFFTGMIWFFIMGCKKGGYLRKSITLRSSDNDTTVTVEYGDIFKPDGFVAIPVNEYFFYEVDNHKVHKSTLHGKHINKYWGSNAADWKLQVEKQISGSELSEVNSVSGEVLKKYPIGKTALVKHENMKFLCFAFTNTNIMSEDYEASATIENLTASLRGLLEKARSVCGGEKLYLPLVGSGAGKIGIPSKRLLNIILAIVFDETKKRKITDEIHIVLYNGSPETIDLGLIFKTWS